MSRPPKHKPDTSDRTRAAKALDLRLSGLSWEQCAKRLGYRSPGGPRMAVERLLARVEAEGAAQLRAVEGRRLDEMLAAVWDKACTGDTDAIRTVLRVSERRCKLLGLDAPQRVEVEGISEREFAEAAAELLKVTGVRPLIEAALPALPPAEREAWLRVEADDHQDDAPAPWSNLGTGHGPLYGSAGPAPTRSDHPDADGPSTGLSEPFTGIPDDDQGDDPEEPVEVVAELIEPDPCGCAGPRPPGQRVLAAVEVLDENGVPRSRTGLARRLGGYNPLVGWTPG